MGLATESDAAAGAVDAAESSRSLTPRSILRRITPDRSSSGGGERKSVTFEVR